jgi:hypothetical protein
MVMIPKGVRYTAAFPTVVSLKDVDKRRKTLTVRITSDSVDRDGEVILPGGGDFRHYRDCPVVLWSHQYSTPAIAKSLWERVSDDGRSVLACPQFASTDFAQQVFELYADEVLRAWSVGFSRLRPSRGPTQAELKARPDWRGAKQMTDAWELYEYSACNVPANADALSLALRTGERVLSKAVRSALDLTPNSEDLYRTAKVHVVKVRCPMARRL